MEKVIGVGGVFIRAKKPLELALWYQQHLGIPLSPDAPYGSFIAQQGDETVWSTFASDTPYLGAQSQQSMINYRVANLDAMLAQLRAANVWVDDQIEDGDYGKFGWARDPEGNRFELWQPKS